MSEIFGLSLIVAVISFGVGFASYWTGKDSGSKQAYYWRKKFEDERNACKLLRKQCDALISELDTFFPKSVWRNSKWSQPEQGDWQSMAGPSPMGYREQ